MRTRRIKDDHTDLKVLDAERLGHGRAEIRISGKSRSAASGLDAEALAKTEAEKLGMDDPAIYIEQRNSTIYNPDEERYEKTYVLVPR